MSALSFPASPATYDRHTENGKTWYWDGTTWIYGLGPGPADPYFSSVVCLLHFEEFESSGGLLNNGSVTADITIGSATSSNANAGGLATTQTKFTNRSFLSNASSYISGASDTTNYALGTGDFTLEAWIYPTSFPGNVNLWDFRNAGAAVSPIMNLVSVNASTATPRFVFGSTVAITGTSGAVVVNAWHHLAIARASGTTKLYLDGAQQGSNYTDSNNYVCGNGFGLCNSNMKSGIGTVPFIGYLGEARITKGVARYTGATYTVPTARFPDR